MPIELIEEENGCKVEENAQSDSIEDESFVDSNYNFRMMKMMTFSRNLLSMLIKSLKRRRR